jgi:hypothetical protein
VLSGYVLYSSPKRSLQSSRSASCCYHYLSIYLSIYVDVVVVVVVVVVAVA